MTASPNLLASGLWLKARNTTPALCSSRDTLLRRCIDGHLNPGRHYIATGADRTNPRPWPISSCKQKWPDGLEQRSDR
jgi:hypothetical protein